MRIIDNTARITAQNVTDAIVNLKQLVFEVTNDCNLSCKYCIYGDFYSGFDHKESHALSFDTAKAIIDHVVGIWKSNPVLSESQITTISFYGGEPLLNFPLIQQIVNYVQNLDVKRSFFFSMTSNCVLLDRYADYLADNHFYLLCSLDGNKFSNAYRVRKDGSPSFDRVFSNIIALKNKYPDYFKEFVSFNTVLHNLNSVSEIVSFFKENFEKTPNITELNDVGVRKEQQETFKNAFKNLYESLYQSENYEELSKELGSGSPAVHDTMCYVDMKSESIYSSYCDLYNDEEVCITTPSGTCLPFSKKMFVTVDGKILQCERINHDFMLGNVQDSKVNLDTEKIATYFNSYLDKIQPCCSVCARKSSCLQCVFQLSDIKTSKPVCRGFMNKEQYANYELNCRRYLYNHPELYRKVMEETVYE